MNRSSARPAGRARVPFPARVAAWLGVVCAIAPGGSARAQSPLEEVFRAVEPSIVTVTVLFDSKASVRRSADPSGAVPVVRPGSGVIVDPEGLILTNLHLVAEVLEAQGGSESDYWATVTLANGRSYPATVAASDARTDLALLRINAGSARLPALGLGRRRSLLPGERALAFSRAAGDGMQMFAGALGFSGAPTRLRGEVLSPKETLLTDAHFHATLDGGPLVDLRGRILGLHNSSHVSSRGEGFSGEEEEDEAGARKVDEGYAVIVSADAIRAALPDWFSADTDPTVPLPGGPPAEAVAPIAAIAPSVVSVWTDPDEPHPDHPEPTDPHCQRPSARLGSGVILGPGGLVVTAAELFPEGQLHASVRLGSGELFPARLLELRRSRKLALLALDLPADRTLPAAVLADSRAAITGEFAAVVGRPFVEPTLSVGVLSALEREGFLQVASWVHRGHLGGALVDRNGRLLGIATDQPQGAGRITASSYLGFAAPTAGLLEAFATVFAEHGAPSVPAYEQAEVEARRSPVSRVVELTKGSLVNVTVSRAQAVESTGFNPFDEPERSFSPVGQGSGVVIDPSGLALSNWHVVSAALRDGVQADDHRVEVTLPTGERYVASVLSTSRDDDLALLSLQLEPGRTLVPVELGESSRLRPGQVVIAIGNPLGLANSVSAGIVTNTSLDVRIQGRLRRYEGMLMTDAAINPGNSGGALLDEHGRLVGINSAGRVGAGLAIPIDKARAVFADKLLSAENLRSSFLGLRVTEQDGALVVTAVEDLSPAAAARLEIGDELLELDGRRGLTLVAFAQALLEAPPGEVLTLRLGRRGNELDVELVPIPYAAWNAFRQSGILVSEVDYAAESALVHEASIALHRTYTGDLQGRPARLMRGALRVEGVRPIEVGRDLALRPGDLLLGITTALRGEFGDTHDLTRFEDLADLGAAFELRATKEGERSECWLWREGEVLNVPVLIRRPPR